MLLYIHTGFLPRNTRVFEVVFQWLYKGIFLSPLSLSFSLSNTLLFSTSLSHQILLCIPFVRCLKPLTFIIVAESPLLQENFFPGKTLKIMGAFDMFEVGLNFCRNYSRGRQIKLTTKNTCIHSWWWLECEPSRENEYLEPKRFTCEKRPFEYDTVMSISPIVFGDLRLFTHAMYEWTVTKKKKKKVVLFNIWFSHLVLHVCVHMHVCVEAKSSSWSF